MESFDFKHRVTTPPGRKPAHYDVQLLELARMDIENGGQFPLNPRDRNISSYFLADLDWMNDLNLHMGWIRYEYDRQRDKD